jgi:hypothetical protein
MTNRTQKLEGFKGREKAILMGSLLGDGMIQRRGQSFRYRVSQGIQQEEYVTWKYNQLNRLCQNTQAPKKVKDKKGFETVEFYSSSGAYLKEPFELFYKESPVGLGKRPGSYVKTITPELIDQLPMERDVLAVWLMDDGSVRNDCYAGNLATQWFSLEENHLLQTYLKKWDINSNIVRHTKASNQYYIYIPSRSFPRLIELVEPVIKEVPSMAYKLNEDRRGKARPGPPPVCLDLIL